MNGMSVTIIKLYIKIPEYLFPKKKTLSNLNKCLFSMKRDKRRVSNIFPGQRVRDGSGRNTPEYEAVFRPENFRIFSYAFRSLFCAFRQELVVNHREKFGNFPAGMLLPCSGDFRCIPAGSSVFSISFLQVPSGSGHRNLRPGFIVDSFVSPFCFSGIVPLNFF